MSTTMLISPRALLVLALHVGALALGCKQSSADVDDPTPKRLRPSASSAPSAPPARGEPFEVADLGHVDPQELVAQARMIAVRIEPHAVLEAISVQGGQLTGGTIDLTGKNAITYMFEWIYLDKTRPPGQDKVEGALWIEASGGRFVARPHSHAIQLLQALQRVSTPTPDPRCRVRDAWTAVVKSGVPANAVPSLFYHKRSTEKLFVWLFMVDGHPELSRRVDGATCAIVD